MELRCAFKLHGILLTSSCGTLEVKCDSQLCGASKGLIILHRFDLETGDLSETLRFKQPKKGVTSGNLRNRTSVRSP